jgi:hypothetical protein
VDLRARRFQAPAVLPRGDTDEHLLDDATIQRVGVGERLERRQRNLVAIRPDAGPANLHLASAQDDLTRDPPRARRRTLGLMLIPRAAEGRPIRFEHRGEDLQARRDGQFHQLGSRIDEEIDEGQVALCGGLDLVRPIDCARLSCHGGSWLAGFRPGLVTGRIARPARSRRSQISTTAGASPTLRMKIVCVRVPFIVVTFATWN